MVSSVFLSRFFWQIREYSSTRAGIAFSTSKATTSLHCIVNNEFIAQSLANRSFGCGGSVGSARWFINTIEFISVSSS